MSELFYKLRKEIALNIKLYTNRIGDYDAMRYINKAIDEAEKQYKAEIEAKDREIEKWKMSRNEWRKAGIKKAKELSEQNEQLKKVIEQAREALEETIRRVPSKGGSRKIGGDENEKT